MDNLTRDQDQLMRKIAAQAGKQEFDAMRRLGAGVDVAIESAIAVLAEVKEIARSAP